MNDDLKKVKLKPIDELEKMGKIYSKSHLGDKVILTNGTGSYKVFDISSFKSIFSVTSTTKMISLEEYEAYQDLFEEIKQHN